MWLCLHEVHPSRVAPPHRPLRVPSLRAGRSCGGCWSGSQPAAAPRPARARTQQDDSTGAGQHEKTKKSPRAPGMAGRAADKGRAGSKNSGPSNAGGRSRTVGRRACRDSCTRVRTRSGLSSTSSSSSSSITGRAQQHVIAFDIVVVDHRQRQAAAGRAQRHKHHRHRRCHRHHYHGPPLTGWRGGGRNQTVATHWLRRWHNGENLNGATTSSTRTSGPTSWRAALGLRLARASRRAAPDECRTATARVFTPAARSMGRCRSEERPQ